MPMEMNDYNRKRIIAAIAAGIAATTAAGACIGFTLGGPLGAFAGGAISAAASILVLKHIAKLWRDKYHKKILDWVHTKFHKSFLFKWIIRIFNLREDKLKDIMLEAYQWVDDGMVIVLRANLVARTDSGKDVIIGPEIELAPEEARALDLVDANGDIIKGPQSVKFSAEEILEMRDAA